MGIEAFGAYAAPREGIRPPRWGLEAVFRKEPITQDEWLSSTEVNYYAVVEEKTSLCERGFRTSGASNENGRGVYIISPVNYDNKTSFGFKDCTGVAAIGIERDTGKPISILSHQDPEAAVSRTFLKDLESTLQELSDRCDPGTIDIKLFGGNIDVGNDTGRQSEIYRNYINSIHALASCAKSVLGIVPTVVGGPKFPRYGEWDDYVHFDTKNARLEVHRNNHKDETMIEFSADDVEEAVDALSKQAKERESQTTESIQTDLRISSSLTVNNFMSSVQKNNNRSRNQQATPSITF